jgi:hypothetical protein
LPKFLPGLAFFCGDLWDALKNLPQALQKRGMGTLEEWAQKVRIPSATTTMCYDVLWLLPEDSSPLIQNKLMNMMTIMIQSIALEPY